MYERALPLPTSSPLMHNQLSKLTYLPDAHEAHGTGPAVVQKKKTVPICEKICSQTGFSERLVFVFALTLIDIAGTTCAQCQGRENRCSHTHLYTCRFLPARTHKHTHTQADQREEKGPKKNQMTCTRLNEGGPGVWQLPQTISSPRCSLWRALSPPPVNG